MHRLWVVQRTNKEFVDYLSAAAGLSPAVARVFINRGIKSPEDANSFLSPDIAALKDPMEMAGMREAVEAVTEARAKNTPVLVHGDYDVDGVASAAIMVDTLRSLGIDARYFIPNRFSHGYGFHPECVSRAAQTGAGLIITTDCGITAFETARLARQKGIKLVITDHHEPDRDEAGNPLMPEAAAVINPKLTPGAPELSGTGVAFKLAQAILGADANAYLDLAALGTLADMVPLTGENRTIAKEGLSLIGKNPRTAIRALMEVAGISARQPGDGREISGRSVCYTLIPRLNAAGRLDDAAQAVHFLLCRDPEEAARLAADLDRLNRERQRLEESLCAEAKRMLNITGYDGAIVLCGTDWHKGVLGIVASRLAEEFCRPAVVLSAEGDIAKGSARSIPQFDLYKGFNELKDMLLGFGGHRQAAGVRIKTGMIDAFRSGLSELVKREVADFRPTLMIDADITLREVNFALVRELSRMEPFGHSNPEPLFGVKGLEVVSPRIVGNGHLKMKLKHKTGPYTLDAIGFDMAPFMKTIEDSLIVDAAFTPQINEWNGGKILQLNLRGLRPSHA